MSRTLTVSACFAIALACSRSALDVPLSGPWPGSLLNGDAASSCATTFKPLVPCSGLRLLTVKEPLPLDPSMVTSAAMIGPYDASLALVTADGRWATLTIDNGALSPAGVHQLALGANDALLGLATDGQTFYGCVEHLVTTFGGRLASFAPDGTQSSSLDFPKFAQHACPVAARDGRVVAAYDALGDGRIIVTEDDAIRWSRTLPAGLPFGTAAQSCGLAYVASADGHDGTSPAVVTWLGFDTPERSDFLDLEWLPYFYAWPYEAHTIAVLTQPQTPEASSCPISLRLIAESTGIITTRTFAHDCKFPIASEGFVTASITPSSFGVVLHDGSGNFQLLDAAGTEAGPSVSIPLASKTDMRISTIGEYVVVLTVEGVTVTQTVLTCER